MQLHYYTVRAPASGVIGDIPVHVGDHVSAQTMLTTVDKGGALEAYLNVPAEKSAALKMGMPVDLVDDQGKALTRTKISFISPHVDTDSQTLLVKAQVPNADMKFRNAQQVHARVVWSERKAHGHPHNGGHAAEREAVCFCCRRRRTESGGAAAGD